MRRQFLIERGSQIEAVNERMRGLEEAEKLDTLSDSSRCKKVWARWVDALSLRIKRRIENEPTSLLASTCLNAD